MHQKERKWSSSSSPSVCIHGQEIEVVEKHKYLDTMLDNKLSFNAICAKAHQSMYLYRKRRGFNVDNIFMKMFHADSVICWFGSLTIENRKKLENIVKLCSKVSGIRLNDVVLLYRVRATWKVERIQGDRNHPTSYKYQDAFRKEVLQTAEQIHIPFIPTTIN